MARKKEPELISINQDKIALKAKELFRSKGFDGLKMEEIAKEVGMSKTTLYTYFKNKEQIKNYLSMQAMDAFYQELCTVKRFQKETLHGRYMQICETLVDFKENYPEEFELMVDNICVDPEILKQDPILQSIYEKGEMVNQLVFVLFEDILQSSKEGERILFTQWGSIYGLITLAYSKEEYFMQQMHLTKEEFLKNGFEDLFQCLVNQGVEVESNE